MAACSHTVSPAVDLARNAGAAVPKCILIVDDHEQVRKTVRRFLEDETGFEICGEAVDGHDAIEQAQRLKPDLIILDLSMPRMNGLQAAPKLKKIFPQVPIVLLTSNHAALGGGFDASAFGIDVVAAKGHELAVLADSLRSLLQEA